MLAFPGGPTLYHAGDTMLFGDMALIRELWAPDIAFLPIGGHFTMDPDPGRPRRPPAGTETVVPIHFGTFPILAGTPGELAAALSGSGIEVAALEPGVPVRLNRRGPTAQSDPSRASATGALQARQRCAPRKSGSPHSGQWYRSHSARAQADVAAPGPRRRPAPATAGWRAASPGGRWPGGSR